MMTKRNNEETTFLREVVKLARSLGYLVYHQHDSRKNRFSESDNGFVDLVFCRFPRLLFVELKSARGRLSDEQKTWLYQMGAFSDAINAAHLQTAFQISERGSAHEVSYDAGELYVGTHVWKAGMDFAEIARAFGAESLVTA